MSQEESKIAEKYQESQEAKKFNADEMKEVKDIQTSYVDIQQQYGQLGVAKLRLNQQLDALDKKQEELDTAFINTQNKEKEFISKITEKYGDGVLDPKTGVYNKS
tara:strand:+ start:962 stop:1276 length:315 start_codon:yes stop_codon:yes gene_type:complete